MAQSSFIPKTIPERLSRVKEPLGILMFLGVLIFGLSLMTLGGLFFYRRLLTNQVQDLSNSLSRLEADFDPASIEELARTASSIEIAKTVLARHRYLSNVFLFLEKNTLPDVRFSKFSFDAANSTANLAAQAKSYTALAQQREIFRSEPSVNNLVLSSLTLTPEGGVTFTAELTFNPAILFSN